MAPIRVMSAGAVFWGLALLRGDSLQTLSYLKDRFVLTRVLVGMTAGPFVGILCYVGALKHAPAGLVSTIAATCPLFVLPMLAIRRHQPIRRDIAFATVVAIAGVALVCLPSA